MTFDVKNFIKAVDEDKKVRDENVTVIHDKPGSFMATAAEIKEQIEDKDLPIGKHKVWLKRVWTGFGGDNGTPYFAMSFEGMEGDAKGKEKIKSFWFQKKDGTDSLYNQGEAVKAAIAYLEGFTQDNAREIIKKSLDAAHENEKTSTLFKDDGDKQVIGELSITKNKEWTNIYFMKYAEQKEEAKKESPSYHDIEL